MNISRKNFLIGSMAVFTQLFGYAVERSDSSRALTEAVAAAENAAERFAADPASAPAQVLTAARSLPAVRRRRL